MKFIPKTKLGRLSVELILSFVFFMIIFYSFVYAGYRGGDTFFSNPFLSIPILFAAISGISASVVGIVSVFKKERNLFVFLSILIGIFVFIFILGELISPH